MTEDTEDMYDKLGNLLKNAIFEGNIGTDSENQDDIDDNPSEKADSAIDDIKTEVKNTKKVVIPDNSDTPIKGEVINMHKYTDFMQFPEEIKTALYTLDIVYPVTIKQIKKQYHKKLKELHPDKNTGKITKITRQESKNVYKTVQLSINILQYYYKILLAYFSV